jgi:SNF2 family DNA or RNA helicase
MKITPIKTMIKGTQLGLGTGKDQGYEVFPTTNTLIKHFNIHPSNMVELETKQQKKLEELPDYESINKLREYQTEDVKFLGARLAAGCFNEQRTGKTPTSLSTMKVKTVTKLLIIAPASTLYTWAEECHNWWFEDLPAVVVDGTAAKRKEIIEHWTEGALIISYECLRETQRTVRNEWGDIQEIYSTGDLAYIKKHKDIQGVILDEAHRIKNHKSKQASALFSLSYIPHRLALTGTPAPGKQHEIFSILHWLYPKIFTGYWRFIDYYFTQYEEYNANGKYKVIGTFKPGKAKELQEFLDIISTRRLRSSVMSWLPEKDKQIIKLPLTKEQDKYIQELNNYFEVDGTDVNAVNILAKLMKIRQVLLAPQVLGLKGKSPKAEWIKQYLEDYPDKKVLIFSNFTEWLKLLGEELNCDNFIIGETSKARREELKNAFQSGKIRLLLINIKAGKEGITLDSADVAIFTDKYPPVGDILQAEDRFVATTKDKLNTGHTIIDLVMADSYEVNILRMLENNASEVDIINNYIKYLKEVS